MDMRSVETLTLIHEGLKSLTNPFLYYMAQKNAFKLGEKITPIGAAFYIVPLINAVQRSGTKEEKELVFTAMLQYKAFIQAFKEFNDPESSNYLNKDLLNQTAEDYFDHKTERGISFSKLDDTSKSRLKLVSSVIKTINDMEDKDTVEKEIKNNLKELIPVVRKQFLNENDIKDNTIVEEINNDNNIIISNEKSIDW